MKFSTKIKELKHQLDNVVSYAPLYYTKKLNDATKILDLQNQVAALSNYSVADALMCTLRQIAYMSLEQNTEFYCKHLEEAVRDLSSGMNAVEMLCKYDMMLHDLKT